MPNTPAIAAPGGFVPQQALSFRTPDGGSTIVDAASPLPIAPTLIAAVSTPLIGSTGVAAVAGPFVPQLGRPIWLILSGSWTGSAQLLRSTDGGTTKLPLTYGDGSARPGWTGNLQSAVAEESVAAATYYLALVPATGTLTYRLEQ